jgi:type IV pilus assembly protein PilO
MAIGPKSQPDQIKVVVALVAAALAVAYYMYPYASQQEAIAQQTAHVESLERSNARARAEVAKGTVDELRKRGERDRLNLVAMRRLVPVDHEVPGLLEQVSTAARRAGLEIGGVTPEPVINGEEFDTYRYKLTVVGGYHALGEFLGNVGSLTRIVAPVGFEVVPALAPTGPNAPASRVPKLESRVLIQAYVAHAARPSDAPRRKPAGAPATPEAES